MVKFTTVRNEWPTDAMSASATVYSVVVVVVVEVVVVTSFSL